MASKFFDWQTKRTIGGTVIVFLWNTCSSIYFHVLGIMTIYLPYDPEL